MTDSELIDLINSISEEKIGSIESINPSENKTVVVGLSTNKVKLIEFTLTISGDFSYRFIGTKLRDLTAM
jgi:hypothetical protein